jgi:hypothetical protein
MFNRPANFAPPAVFGSSLSPQSSQEKDGSDELHDDAPGDQFLADVYRCGFGADASGRGGLGGVGLGVGKRGVFVFVGDLGLGGSGMAGCGVAGDDGGGLAVHGVA